MNERPKSREETPKEGSGTAWSHTALQQYVIAPHKVQGSIGVLSGISETVMRLGNGLPWSGLWGAVS